MLFYLEGVVAVAVAVAGGVVERGVGGVVERVAGGVVERGVGGVVERVAGGVVERGVGGVVERGVGVVGLGLSHSYHLNNKNSVHNSSMIVSIMYLPYSSSSDSRSENS